MRQALEELADAAIDALVTGVGPIALALITMLTMPIWIVPYLIYKRRRGK